MTCQFKFDILWNSPSCQGSCVVSLRAEKADVLPAGIVSFVSTADQGSCAALLRTEKTTEQRMTVQLPNLVRPAASRSDGGKPARALGPSNLPTFSPHLLTCVCARTRIRARVSPIVFYKTTSKQVRQVRRLDETNIYKGFSRLTFCPTLERLDK